MYCSKTAAWATTTDLMGVRSSYGRSHRIKMDSALNLPFQEWTEVLGSERLTGALLDRLTHHVDILEMNGDSYRLKQSKRKQKSQPASA